MNKTPLKIYVNKKFTDPNLQHIPFLFPFWGEILKDKAPYDRKTQQYGFDKSYFTLSSSIHDAEYVLVPYDYWHLKRKRPDLLHKIIDEAQRNHKPLFIDASGDVFGKINVPNSRILRINQYRFDLPKNEITVPVPCEDLLESYYNNQLVFRNKADIPTIGFVGWGVLSLEQRLRTVIKELPRRFVSLFIRRYVVYRKGVFWREKAIKIFRKSNIIHTNFIIRNSYGGHANTLTGDPEKNRREFFQNISNSDYTLIVRGDANAATRFYETLSLGRIPVVIDTECMFPLEDKINYKEFCVFIPYTDIDRAPELLAQFHKNISPDEFVAMQEKARYIFKNYLRYDAFSRHLAEILRTHLSQYKNI